VTNIPQRKKPKPTPPPKNIEERIEELDAEQKKLLQVVHELKKLNQQVQMVRT
jgi:hypothetical protein